MTNTVNSIYTSSTQEKHIIVEYENYLIQFLEDNTKNDKSDTMTTSISKPKVTSSSNLYSKLLVDLTKVKVVSQISDNYKDTICKLIKNILQLEVSLNHFQIKSLKESELRITQSNHTLYIKKFKRTYSALSAIVVKKLLKVNNVLNWLFKYKHSIHRDAQINSKKSLVQYLNSILACKKLIIAKKVKLSVIDSTIINLNISTDVINPDIATSLCSDGTENCHNSSSLVDTLLNLHYQDTCKLQNIINTKDVDNDVDLQLNEEIDTAINRDLLSYISLQDTLYFSSLKNFIKNLYTADALLEKHNNYKLLVDTDEGQETHDNLLQLPTAPVLLDTESTEEFITLTGTRINTNLFEVNNQFNLSKFIHTVFENNIKSILNFMLRVSIFIYS